MASKSTVFCSIPMGFNVNLEGYRYKASVEIHSFLQHFVGKQCILQILCRDLIAASHRAPLSIGDMMSFFVGICEFWSKKKTEDLDDDFEEADYNRVKDYLEKWIDECPGTFKADKLTGALEKVVKGHEKKEAGAVSHIENGNELTHNLTSLLHCPESLKGNQRSNTAHCSPYLKPLSYDVYTVFVPQFARAYLSWILHFGPSIYGSLSELKDYLNTHKWEFKSTHSASSSTFIVKCPVALPRMYTLGLDFWDAKSLNGENNNKNCTHLVTQLEAVLRTCDTTPSPLHKLIEVIEEFLWSIREPFAYSQFGLWTLAVLFLCYVFVVPLDHFKIKSHYFNQVRFTMHPSLLLSHGARRVTDVSYFKM